MWGESARSHPGDRGFAAAALADKTEDIALVEGQGNIVGGLDPTAFGVVFLDQMLQFHDRFGHVGIP